MVSALDSGSSGLGSSPGRGHCVVFLGKTLYSHSTSLYPSVKKVPGKLMLGVTLSWTSIPSAEGGVEIQFFFTWVERGTVRVKCLVRVKG